MGYNLKGDAMAYDRKGEMIGKGKNIIFKVDVTNSENYTKDEVTKILNALAENKKNLISQRTAYIEALKKMDADEIKIDGDIAFFKDRVPSDWVTAVASANADGTNKTK